jgi:hypothetical protein
MEQEIVGEMDFLREASSSFEQNTQDNVSWTGVRRSFYDPTLQERRMGSTRSTLFLRILFPGQA